MRRLLSVVLIFAIMFSIITSIGQIEVQAAEQQSETPVNVALASNGGVAEASSEYSSAFPANAVTDGDVIGGLWGFRPWPWMRA